MNNLIKKLFFFNLKFDIKSYYIIIANMNIYLLLLLMVVVAVVVVVDYLYLEKINRKTQ